MMSRQNSKLALLVATLVAGAAFTGCGTQEYAVAQSQSAAQTPGTYMIPPKVDIMLAENDTGRMFEAYAQVQAQMPAFLTSLQAAGWDYRFVTTPLTTPRAFSQALASNYDSNWGSLWTPAFPGAPETSTLPSGLFTLPGNYTQFLTTVDVSNAKQGFEPGFETIHGALTAGANIFRPDALLVVVALSTGDDTSGITYCSRAGDNYSVPCENTNNVSYNGTHTNGVCLKDGVVAPCASTTASSYTAMKASIIAAAPSVGGVSNFKFFSAVASEQTNNCLGGSSSIGNRYKSIAGELGGASYDVCTQPISSVLSGIGANLQAQKLSYRTHYLFIAQDANPATIIVTRYIGGDGANSVVIPQDDTNGWKYVGYVNNVYAIDSPIPMNMTSGYAIELNGTAELLGDDTADVQFKPAGAVGH